MPLKQTWCLTSTETVRLIRDGEKGEKGVWRWGRGRLLYPSLHCHHQNDSYIMMGSDESHFNVSIGSDGQSHKTVSTNHNLSEEKGEPKRYRTEVLPLTSLPPYRWATPALSRCRFVLFLLNVLRCRSRSSLYIAVVCTARSLFSASTLVVNRCFDSIKVILCRSILCRIVFCLADFMFSVYFGLNSNLYCVL